VFGQREAQRLEQADAGVMQVVVGPQLAAGQLRRGDRVQPQRVEAQRVGRLRAVAGDAGNELHGDAFGGWLSAMCGSNQSWPTWAWIRIWSPKLQPVRICSR